MWNNIDIRDFDIYASCPTSKVNPIVDIVENSLIIPVAPDDYNCQKNFLDAVGRTSHILHDFSFKGTFIGGNTAPSATEEMAIFACDNKVTWDGQEFGFVLTNNDNTLKGYAQGRTYIGGKFYKYVVLDKVPDGLEHVYMASVSRYEHNKIYYYIDGLLKGYIDTNLDYCDIPYYMVGTTHRNIGEWSSDDYKLIIKDLKYL